MISGTCSLGVLDPDLYNGSDDDCAPASGFESVGRLRFSVEFDAGAERLLVCVIRAKNLTSSTLGIRNSLTSSRLCDSYVK